MTEPEFETVVEDIKSRWPRYDLPDGLVRSLWDRFNRYTLDAVLAEVQRMASEDLDSIRPNWRAVSDRLSGSVLPSAAWSIANEHMLGEIVRWYVREGKGVPSVEYIATNHLGKPQSPSTEDRERARKAIEECYPRVRAHNPEFDCTYEGIRRQQAKDVKSWRTHCEMAPCLTTGKKRERPLCDQPQTGRMSYEDYLFLLPERTQDERQESGSDAEPPF